MQALWQWAALAGRLGASFPLMRPFLICIRGAKPGDAQDHELIHAPVYDDAFCFIPPGETQLLFAAASHAYQLRSTESPKDGTDGIGDVGSVRPGRYLLNDTNNGAEVVFHITLPDGTDRLPAWRDYDHDGKISPAELQGSEDARTGPQIGAEGTYASSILLHGGLDEPPHPDGTPPAHRFSIGCFTAPLRYRKIMSDKAKAHGGKIDCALVLAPKAVELVASLPAWDPEPFPLDGGNVA